ncbi:MAG: phosphoribosylamine--glycine ligase [Phycisphaerales bacterium]|jgi:phosphoribosylamine---glycine ligase|nr:phosphoribosylamine--glycine ligase [Phycisphaerales bacterium]MBT7171974.1 phosphoribosylamine--glycine ligase [Phycisphaerales bacterium]
MKVLIVGGGGREHALAWKILQSPQCDALYAAPGNPGIKADGGTCVDIDVLDTPGLIEFAKTTDIGLVVVGPEVPLANGLGDAVREAGLLCFGPSKKGARIESDKAYSKLLMQQASVPTAEARIFTDLEDARTFVLSRDHGVVVKASGLAAGKGVIVCKEPYQAIKPLEDMMEGGVFGDAGSTVVIEELLTGQEASVLALCDGKNIYPLEPLQDHKPIGEGDTGPNTGGMGAYSPVPIVGPDEMDRIEREILVPIVDAMRRDFGRYEGLLYAGVMFTPGGPKVIEFNCRFGDPECQPAVMRIKGDLLEILLATAEHRLDEIEIEYDPRPSVCVVMTAEGYPGPYEKGRPITGVADADALEDVKVFHAGTIMSVDGDLLCNGGRVLGVTALGDTLEEAQAKAYEAVDKIHFDGAYVRRDIGSKAIGN